jgi:hypothetical protein
MGDLAAMYSLLRFMENHGDQLREENLDDLPATLRARHPTIVLSNEVNRLLVWAEFSGPRDGVKRIRLEPYDLDQSIFGTRLSGCLSIPQDRGFWG